MKRSQHKTRFRNSILQKSQEIKMRTKRTLKQVKDDKRVLEYIRKPEKNDRKGGHRFTHLAGKRPTVIFARTTIGCAECANHR